MLQELGHHRDRQDERRRPHRASAEPIRLHDGTPHAEDAPTIRRPIPSLSATIAHAVSPSAVNLRMSPGWQSSARQIASSVEKRIALALPVFRIDRLAIVMSTPATARSASCRRACEHAVERDDDGHQTVIARSSRMPAPDAEHAGEHEQHHDPDPAGEAGHPCRVIDADPGRARARSRRKRDRAAGSRAAPSRSAGADRRWRRRTGRRRAPSRRSRSRRLNRWYTATHATMPRTPSAAQHRNRSRRHSGRDIWSAICAVSASPKTNESDDRDHGKPNRDNPVQPVREPHQSARDDENTILHADPSVYR